jgi:hypothetical protein
MTIIEIIDFWVESFGNLFGLMILMKTQIHTNKISSDIPDQLLILFQTSTPLDGFVVNAGIKN